MAHPISSEQLARSYFREDTGRLQRYRIAVAPAQKNKKRCRLWQRLFRR